MALHVLEPVRETLHGSYCRDCAPILTIDSGDTVRYRTLDAGWNVEPWQQPKPGTARKIGTDHGLLVGFLLVIRVLRPNWPPTPYPLC